MDVNPCNFNININPWVNFQYQDIFSVNARFDLAYIEPVRRGCDYRLDGGSKNMTDFELTGEYDIESYLQQTSQRVVVNIVKEPSVTHVYYINIPADILVRSALRGGFMARNTFCGDDLAKYSGYNVSDPAKKVKDLYGFGTMMHENILFAGYSFSEIWDMVVNVDVYGKKKKKMIECLYADIMYAPVMTFQDATQIYADDKPNVYKTFHVNDNTPKNHFGLRAGYSQGSLAATGYYLRIEGGFRPSMDIISGAYS